MKEKDCHDCKALCCKYVSAEIDEPDCKKDWDQIIWMLHHENIVVYQDYEDCWFVEFKTKCKNLGEDHKCQIYDERPQLCEDHKAEECEHYNDDSPYQIIFREVDDVKAYLKIKNINYEFGRKN